MSTPTLSVGDTVFVAVKGNTTLVGDGTGGIPTTVRSIRGMVTLEALTGVVLSGDQRPDQRYGQSDAVVETIPSEDTSFKLGMTGNYAVSTASLTFIHRLGQIHYVKST